MAHKCKCPKCGETFDRDIIQAVRLNGRRYGHAACYPDNHDYVPLFEKQEQDQDLLDLEQYILNLYGDLANWILIKKQIKQFHEINNYSYSGMKKSLEYFYRIKGNDIKKANGGIGIIPFVWKDSFNYFYAIWEAQQRNEQFVKNPSYNISSIEIHIKSPERQPMQGKKLAFTFLEDETAFKEEC